jgi:HK97 family phage major capsid protein
MYTITDLKRKIESLELKYNENLTAMERMSVEYPSDATQWTDEQSAEFERIDQEQIENRADVAKFEKLMDSLERENARQAEADNYKRRDLRDHDDATASGIEVTDAPIYRGPFALGAQLADLAASHGRGWGRAKKNRDAATLRLEQCENRRAHIANIMHKSMNRAAGDPSFQEGVYEEGGIFLEVETSMDVVRDMFNNDAILSRCDRRTMTGPTDRLDMISASQDTRKDTATAPEVSRHGGVRWYWDHELDDLDFSAMKWEKQTVQVKKLRSAYNASEEILQDVGFLTGEVNQVVGDELAFKVQVELMDGLAPGAFIGLLNAPCKIETPKVATQAADTIIYENARDMKVRQRRFANSVWLIHQFAQPQLESLHIPIGDGGALVSTMIYRPATGEGAFDTLYGRPVIPIEQCEPLGDAGDIVNVDLSRYVVVDKGGMEMASSIHVFFVYDQRTFKFRVRMGGMPKDKTALQMYKGTDEVSSIITLAERA